MTPRPWYGRLRTWKWAAASTAAAALGAGLTLQLLAVRNTDRLESTRPGGLSFKQAAKLQSTITWQRTGAGLAYGIAGTAAATSLVLFLLDRSNARSSARTSVVAAGIAGPDGGGLLVGGQF